MSQQRKILERFNQLKPWLGVADAVCLKSYGPFQAPCGFELVAGTLIRLGLHSAEIHISGNAFMVPTVLVHIAKVQRGLQPPRRDEMCPTSGEKRRPTPPPNR